MRKGMRRRKPRVVWVETADSLIDQVTIFGPGASPSLQTFVFPLLADESNANDKADLAFTMKSAGLLGISDWGTALTELYEKGFKATRLVGHLGFALQQRIQSAGASPTVGAVNVLVRAGIFIGEVDENGAIVNAADWRLDSREDWKDRRWLWTREWSLHNRYGGITGTIASGGPALTPTDTWAVAAADLPRVIWGHPTNTMYAGTMSNDFFDIKHAGTLAKNQRLFYAYAAWDHAQGPQDITVMATSWTLLRNKRCRALLSPGFKRART